MNIFIYSDESGVFDKKHNNIYVYGGLVFLSKEEKDNATRLYIKAEKIIRQNNINFKNNQNEIKASNISIKEKYSLFRSLNKFNKFSFIIEQKKVLDNIFNSKKDKQRYLDYVYKVGLKKILETLLIEKNLNFNEVENIYIYVDEHTTATNGKYELQEALEQEFKLGTYNINYSYWFKPIFPNLKTLNVEFCNSSKKVLIRAADIIANKTYNLYLNNSKTDGKIFTKIFP